MRRARRLAALILLSSLFLTAVAANAGAADPSGSAEQIRAGLVSGQLSLSDGRRLGAIEALDRALRVYAQSLAPDLRPRAARWDQRIQAGFNEAQTAAQAGSVSRFAAARARVWTALLGAGFEMVETSLATGNAAEANRWLSLREYQRATALSRPDADATLAVAAAMSGQGSIDEAAAAVRADLLGTYQVRLDESIDSLVLADRRGFAVRRAELAAFVDGYIAIVVPAYGTQRGASAAERLRVTARGLADAARDGYLDAQALREIRTALNGFRAAPLSPRAQQRRAAQLMRFLSLVPVEYARGVRGGRVTIDLEIREAVTFLDAARAAFAEIRPTLDALDAAATAEVLQRFDALRALIRATEEGGLVAPPSDVRAATERLTARLRSLVPDAWLRVDTLADLSIVDAALNHMEAAASAGRYDVAEASRLEAYAIMESGPEARLRIFAPHLVGPIEELFWYGNGSRPGLAALLSRRAAVRAIRGTRRDLDRVLESARDVIGAPASPAVIVANAAVIVFREGLEAVLILASLLGSLRRPEWRSLRRPLWWGAVAACAATLLTWVAARGALVALARFGERLEAAVSLLAVAVLLLILNWFFHDLYWTGWLAGFHDRKTHLLRSGIGQGAGLFGLGFASIFREGFEVVIFLQALALQVGQRIVAGGVLAGLAGTAVVGLVIFRLHAKLPYRRMLVVTGVLIGFVLLQMVGRTAHTMQIVGWLPAHPIANVTLPFWWGLWFGVFATWEGLIAQLAAGTIVVGSYFLAGRLERLTRRSVTAQSAT